jgi:hypothetical protein
VKDKFKKKKVESYSDLVKTSPYKSSSYDPRTFGSKNYSDTFFKMKKTPLEEIVELRDILRSPYSSRPSYAHIEKVLTYALAEITNLEKKVSRLESDLSEANNDIIEIKIGDETVVIDGDLATQVISSSVKNYITEALEAYSITNSLLSGNEDN